MHKCPLKALFKVQLWSINGFQRHNRSTNKWCNRHSPKATTSEFVLCLWVRSLWPQPATIQGNFKLLIQIRFITLFFNSQVWINRKHWFFLILLYNNTLKSSLKRCHLRKYSLQHNISDNRKELVSQMLCNTTCKYNVFGKKGQNLSIIAVGGMSRHKLGEKKQTFRTRWHDFSLGCVWVSLCLHRCLSITSN